MHIKSIVLDNNTNNEDKKILDIPVIPIINLNLNKIIVLKNFLEGLETGEWLELAEYQVKKKYFNNEN